MKRLLGKSDIEDALRKLDKLTQEEARMATAEVLKVTQRVDEKVTVREMRFSGHIRIPEHRFIRWERSESNHTTKRRRREAFVIPYLVPAGS